MALVTEVLSEVTTRSGTTRLVLTYDDATLAVVSLAVEGKGDPNTQCEAVLRHADGRERERKSVKGEDAALGVAGLKMKRHISRNKRNRQGKETIVPDFPRPSFSTVTRGR